MRPSILFPIFAEARSLKGVGPRAADAMKRLNIYKVVDLLFHRPSQVIDRRVMPSIADALNDSIATFHIYIEAHQPGDNHRQPYRIQCRNTTGYMSLVFFRGNAEYFKKVYPIGAERIISGTVTRYRNSLQMVHPDITASPEQANDILRIQTVYPSTSGITQKILSNAVKTGLTICPDLPEWHDNALIRRESWSGWRNAIATLHNPKHAEDIDPQSKSYRRLAYDELLANQVALGITRRHQRSRGGRSMQHDHKRRGILRSKLPFELTQNQVAILREIDTDMAKQDGMMRLLQGDVGSGKTVIALFAMATAVDSGTQAALLAPTEILARQHMDSLRQIAEAANIRVDLLTGRDRGKARDAKLMALQNGDIQILIGTHAIFQENVDYHNLGCVVIDEQHRFGVHQRLMLSNKGHFPDVLVMTATPIPRTLTMTAYGDMDVSRLTGKPPGRKPVDTRVMPDSKLDQLLDGLKREVERGGQVFWVCPKVAEDDESTSKLTSIEARFAHLNTVFGTRIGFVHGQMAVNDKDATMESFVTGEISILLATTVIEVGINVPNATIMVIENANQFGLAQLHQLRGRVGRGDKPATCILLYRPPISEVARKRLSTMRQSDDGFFIAEKDLELRGAGEILGTKQSGLPEFQLANIATHVDLMRMAHDDATTLLQKDPNLKSERGAAIRTLLYLFERDKAIHFLRSG